MTEAQNTKRPGALIAMSGGVDSSVAAWLMQQAGYDCTGITMRLTRNETLSRIGAIAMDGKTACMEQEGKVCNKLPVATDSRFIMTEQREEAENE